MPRLHYISRMKLSVFNFKPRFFVVSAVVLLLLVVLGECVARFVLGLGDPPLSVADPQVEYMFKPNQDCERFGNRIFVNEWGMRSMPVSPVKQDKTELRIMWFGDSVINGGNQTDHDSLATTLLQNALAKRLQRPVRVLNVSAGSWGPPNMLAYSEKFGLFSADVMVVSLSSHDAADYPNFGPLNLLTHPTRKPLSALVEGVERYLPRYLPSFGPTQAVADYQVDTTMQSQVLGDLSRLIHKAKDSGAKVLVVHHWEESELKKGVQPGRDLIRSVADSSAVDFVSDSALFAGNSGLFRDNIHPNNRGQKAIAAMVQESLSAMGY